MIGSPSFLAWLVVDVLGMLFLSAAALNALRVLSGWSPGAADAGQLRLERRVESASLQGRAAMALLLFGSLTGLVAISGVFVNLVPGAMCGTGVFQAMGTRGESALILRGAGLLALGVWCLLDRFDRQAPRMLIVLATSRALLVATPLVFLGVVESASSVWNLNTHEPVDCCAALYDAVRSSGPGQTGDTGYGLVWAWTCVGLGVVLVVLGVFAWRSRRSGAGWLAPVLAVLSVAWVFVADQALLRVFVAYHYGVLHHRCPWCLFLPEHKLAGYLLYGCLGFALWEGTALVVAWFVARRIDELRPMALRRLAGSGLRLALSVIGFLSLTALPALVWRLNFGVWIGG